MPSWGELLEQINAELAATGQVDLDSMRSKYLGDLAKHTGRSVILYAADLFKPNPMVQVNLQDMVGMMEVFRDLPGPNLDLILHTPGGQAEATDRLVQYLRSKFTHIRVFVPFAAMSAGTMWAMSADEIVMGKHSQLGPIDPQITISPGLPSMPAGALTDQFREAMRECSADPSAITGWLPTLQQYPPGLLNFCENAKALSKSLVAQWLEQYMLSDAQDPAKAAADVSEWLADDKTHLSHSRSITREDLKAHGLKVSNLEQDPVLQDLVLSVHHVMTHTFGGPTFKIIENNLGRRFVQQGGQVVMPGPFMIPPGVPGVPPGAPPP